MNIDNINKTFDDYVSLYDKTDPDIKLKYSHTYRVCEQSMNICNSLNLNEESKYIAYLIAILHDIGRFYQDKMFNTFEDKISFDHGDYGVKILFEDGLIRNFIKESKYDNLIKLGVKNHNKFKIEDGLNEEENLQCKIIKDADKLDIFYLLSSLNELDRYGNNEEISIKVKESFTKHELVDNNDKNNENDSIICIFAFVFDLNFDYSFKYLKETDLINKYYNRLNNKEIFKPYVDEVNKYIELRCNDVR